MAFCLILPINASLNYYREIIDDNAYYISKKADIWTENDDALIVGVVTVPSLVIIFVAFIHYLLIPLNKPQNHHPKILPIFCFKNRFFKFVGKVISYICVYTMPWLIPIGIYIVYNTKRISDDPDEVFCNDTLSLFVYLLPMALAFGAWLFFNFYIVYFIKKIIIHNRKKNGIYEDKTEGWFVY